MVYFNVASDDPTYAATSCVDCPVRPLSLYAPLSGNEIGEIQEMRRESLKIGARQIIMSTGETYGNIYTVFDGWAYRFMLLPDGRRQIFTYFLPGDIIVIEALQTPHAHFSVGTLTNVTLCSFDKKDFQKLVEAKPALKHRFDQLCARKSMASDNRLLDIGKRTARERLVRLIMYLYGDLVRKNLVQNNEFLFPLRHQHIADTIGLTPVHVSRNMSALRGEKLIDKCGRNLVILEEAKLLAQAGLEPNYISKERTRMYHE